MVPHLSGHLFFHIYTSFPNNISESVPKHECESVPKHECESVPKQECESVPKHECESVPKHECDSVPKHECESVPKHASGQVRLHCMVQNRNVCTVISKWDNLYTRFQSIVLFSLTTQYIIHLITHNGQDPRGQYVCNQAKYYHQSYGCQNFEPLVSWRSNLFDLIQPKRIWT